MDYDIIKDNLSKGVYENKVSYPKISCPLKPMISKDSQFYDVVWSEYNTKLDEYRKAKRQYRDGGNEACIKFRNDVIQMLIKSGANNVQAAQAYNISYDRGHGCGGYEQVLDYAEEFAELFSLK